MRRKCGWSGIGYAGGGDQSRPKTLSLCHFGDSGKSQVVSRPGGYAPAAGYFAGGQAGGSVG